MGERTIAAGVWVAFSNRTNVDCCCSTSRKLSQVNQREGKREDEIDADSIFSFAES